MVRVKENDVITNRVSSAFLCISEDCDSRGDFSVEYLQCPGHVEPETSGTSVSRISGVLTSGLPVAGTLLVSRTCGSSVSGPV